jgi:hypothetical protein
MQINLKLGNVVVFIWQTTFLPSGETLENSMKEKSMASVKVLKEYALETGATKIAK